ncbi:MAG: hypothetical protein KatS3mg022_1737 [Armatimonadota bacterium]|nr:MAG: hypothetical protein KatS3mg022_1737 [Armatimonadota bacterium]
MRSLRVVIGMMGIALLCTTTSHAQSLTSKPLHTDSSLAALIAVRGQFTSLIVDAQRQLTLRVWAADFSPNEPVDFDQLLSRSFSELELPEEPGWGLFTPSGDYLEIQVRVTDRQGRLGRVEFRNAETWQLVGSIWANAYRTEASGMFSIPADLREMVAEVLNDTGRVLARIAVDVGKFDTVVPLLVGGNFEPYYIEPAYCSHFGEQPGDAGGSRSGNPYNPPGAKTYVGSGMGRSYSTAYHDFMNDSPVVITDVWPPDPFRGLYRKKTIANTVNFGRFRVADPQAMAQLVQAVSTAAAEDPSRPLPSVQALPYSEGCARWRVGFTGQVTAVLAIPYERKKRQRALEAFLSTIHTLLAPQRGFLSVLAANAANQWLQDLQNQQASGLKPGEVVAWGDVYSVLTDGTMSVPRVVNTVQEWLVYVKARFPDGREEPTSGTVTMEPVQPLLQPGPPPAPAYYQVIVPPEGKLLRLGKGWRYRFLLGSTEQFQANVPAEGTPPTVTLYMDVVPPPR